MKIDRLLSIVILLLNREKITARELAEYFETSVRTIYRDIDTLGMAGIPVMSLQGSGGGYALMPQFKLDKQIFSSQELLSLVSGLRGVETAIKDTSVSSALEKIQSFIPRENSGPDRTPVIDFSPWGGSGQLKEAITVIQKAIAENRLVRFVYHNLKQERTERTVEPMRLFFRSSSWYLMGFCLVKEDYRFFKIARIRELVLEMKTFVPRVTDNEASFLENWNREPRTRITIQVAAPASHRLKEWISPEKLTVLEDGSVEGIVDFPLDEWVYSFLLGLGEHLKVLDPPYIRDEIARRAQSLLENNLPAT